MRRAKTLAATLLTALTLAAATASASQSFAEQSSETVTLAGTQVQVDKTAADTLYRKVEAAPKFGKLRTDAAAPPLARSICDFYAVPPAAKQQVWQQTLTKLVEAGKLTRKDKRALDKLLTEPRQTVANWKPDTEFGQTVIGLVRDRGHQFSTEVDAGYMEEDVEASTAGNVGTIVGAMIGGLGGTPASVGLGAALGKLAGEIVNELGQAAYDLAPDQSGGGDSGRDEGGGAEGGDGGGDGGGEGGEG